MRHIIFGSTAATASVAILVKESNLDQQKVLEHYIAPLKANPAGFIAYSLWYDDNDKCPAAMAKEHLEHVLLSAKQLGLHSILVTDAKYFKYLTGIQKAATEFIGYAMDCTFAGYEKMFTIFYAPNYAAAMYNPKTHKELASALSFFKNHLMGNHQAPGLSIIHTALYPSTVSEISNALTQLHQHPALTVDIETRGLHFWDCGIATISFAWTKHDFIAFPVDRSEYSASIKRLLYAFFTAYQGKLIPHNGSFDFKVMVYNLWMRDLQDYRGMLDGIQTLTRNFDDTKLIAYLATNNAVENVLKLKILAYEFAGNYGLDVTDTDLIVLSELLEYNGKDALSTWFVFDKYYPLMVASDQLAIYEELFKPSMITLLQTELCGMPIFPDQVAKVKRQLTRRRDIYAGILQNSQIIKEFQLAVQTRKCAEFTAAAKKKVFTMDDPRIQRLVFNPNSGQQVADLLYNYLGFTVIDKTDGGQPATGGDTLAKLLNHTQNSGYRKILRSLIGLAQVDKILTSFIPAFEGAVQLPDGSWRLFGNFNLGGTVSGRLSSSDPNLQNLPAHSAFGKMIKKCFGCIDGWLFGGADFNSLEDMVAALTTRDTNKMAVYLDGYDGHCLRAYFYFKAQMPDIVHTVPSINSIKKKYPKLRQDSKAPTFLLTYQGTHHGLMSNLGLDRESALAIERNYHELYKESDEWVAARLQEACLNGYVTGAFGLRLRTPLLKMNGPGKLGYKAAAEGRTAGNMLGQSYGLLNSRAANEFRERVWKSPYKYDIFLCAQIHDAIYLFWRNTVGITKWVNDNIIDCMRWCGLKELQHPTVKLGAELDIYYPHWAYATTLKNGMDLQTILDQCRHKPKGHP
jgi:DNA polymerase-1